MAVTWNSGDASANITLSGGSLSATTTSATQGAVRGNTSAASGKVYFSVAATIPTGSTTAIGWANATAALGTALGTNTNSVAILFTNGQVLLNNGALGTLYATVAKAIVECAWDITNKLIWFRVNYGFWNNSVTANPATGTGGFSTSTLAAGPYFPAFCANSSGASVTAQFGAVDPIYPIPSGFSTLDTAAQTYIAAAKFVGYATIGGFQNAISVSSLKAYAVSGGFQNAVSVAKLLGYVVFYYMPFSNDYGYFTNPMGKKRRNPYLGDLTAVNPGLITPAPPPLPQPMLADPYKGHRRYQDPLGLFPLPLVPTAGAPAPPDFYVPRAKRRSQDFTPTPVPAPTPPPFVPDFYLVKGKRRDQTPQLPVPPTLLGGRPPGAQVIEPIFLRHRRDQTYTPPSPIFRAVFDDFWVTRHI